MTLKSTLAGLGALSGLGYLLWRQQKQQQANVQFWDPSATMPKRLAVITGASSGIGSTFARALAGRGYDLLLTARRESRLQALAKTLADTHGITADVLTADLSREVDIVRLAGEIAVRKDLHLLVNNAGFGTIGHYADIDLDSQLAMVRVHIEAAMRLTHAALPTLLANRSGGIINLSSIAAFLPAPDNVTYSPSKAYLVTFSRSLAMELAGTGVRVQALCPGFTYTEFHDTARYADFDRHRLPDFLWQPAEEVVRHALDSLAAGPVVCIPGWPNLLITTAAQNPLTAPLFFAYMRRRWAASLSA